MARHGQRQNVAHGDHDQNFTIVRGVGTVVLQPHVRMMVIGAALGWTLSFLPLTALVALFFLPWGEHGTRQWSSASGRAPDESFVVVLSRDGEDVVTTIGDLIGEGATRLYGMYQFPDDSYGPASSAAFQRQGGMVLASIGDLALIGVHTTPIDGGFRTETSLVDPSFNEQTHVAIVTSEGVVPRSAWIMYDSPAAIFAVLYVAAFAVLSLIPAAIAAMLGWGPSRAARPPTSGPA